MLPFIENHNKKFAHLPAQIPDHLKCGEVYTWLCNGELYAVECVLCEDKPLCPLSEFPQHMEVWHTDWEEYSESNSITKEQQEDNFFDSDDDEDNASLSFNTEDSGLYEQDHINEGEVLEPFEQVLIEQDETTINSIQINEDVDVDVNEIFTKENKTALLPAVVDVKGEIMLEQIEQPKQNNINKTITEQCNNKYTQTSKQQLHQIELSEMNGMVHTRERELETKEKHKEIENSKNPNNMSHTNKDVTTLLATKNLKRNCDKNHKRELCNFFTYIRDSQRIKDNFLEDNNLVTENPISSNTKFIEEISSENKNIPQQQVQDLGDIVKKLEENEHFLLEKTVRSNLELSSTPTKYMIDIEEKSQAHDNLLHVETNLKECSLDSIRESIDLQEDLLDNKSINQELRHTSNLAENSIDLKIPQQCTNILSDREDNCSQHTERNLREFEEVFTQYVQHPNNPQNFESTTQNSQNATETNSFGQDLDNFKDTKENTTDQTVEKSGHTIQHYPQSLYVQQKQKDYFQMQKSTIDYSAETEQLAENLAESFLGNENLTPEIEYSSESYAKSSEDITLGNEVLNEQVVISNEIEENFLGNQDLIEEVLVSNDLAENIGAEISITSEVIDFMADSFQFINSPAKTEVMCVKTVEDEMYKSIDKNVCNISKANLTTDEISNKASCQTKSKTKRSKSAPEISRNKIEKHLPKEVLAKTCSSNRVSNRINFNRILRSPKRIKNPNESRIIVNSKRRWNTNRKIGKKFKLSYRVKNCKEKSKKAENVSAENPIQSEIFKDNGTTLKQKTTTTPKRVKKNSKVNRRLRSDNKKICKKLNEETCKNSQIAMLNHDLENSYQIGDNTFLATQVSQESCKKKNIDNDSLDSNSVTEAFSTLSPKSEEDHFDFCGLKEKLTQHHIRYLIELYKNHPRLWDQSHTDFCEPHLCRKSWQEITHLWNDYCKRNFTIAEVRIRICTLCQRYLQERERLVLEGELDEFAKFTYYEQMRFLEHQKSLQKRKDLYDKQNEKILEIYEHFPVLWHVSHYKLKQAKARANAFQSISKALKLCGIHLSAVGVEKRIRSLKKCYRLEKIRYLHSQVEQTPFDSTFKHFEKMQFLDKHIDPFVCRICGKIFENLTGFREHLEENNHGSILQEEYESETESEKEEKQSLMDTNCKPEGENFNTISAKGNNLQTLAAENDKPIIQEVLVFAPNSSQATVLKNFPVDEEMMEEIIENVSNTEGLGLQTIDSFINSSNNSEEMTISSASFSEAVFPPVNLETLNSDLNIQEKSLESNNCELPKQDVKVIEANQNVPSSKSKSDSLVVKVQCADFSLNLKLDAEQESSNDSDNGLQLAMDICSVPLPDFEVRKMIELYRKYPQLWNPNHLDYNSRNLRRQAWFTLTTEFCEAVGKQLSWRSLHRKLTDYAKYYKKLIMEHENYENFTVKWTFYKDFKFLDDVIAVHDELQRSVHHRDNNFKIIAIYETLPQLWNIRHPEFNKRCVKHRNIELMCNRLQEENNFQITSERLKNRLIELRAQYRAVKKQRLKCEKNQQKFFTDFEFYDALKFLEDNIDPFTCETCKMEFKKLTDYNHHQKRQHGIKNFQRNDSLSVLQSLEEQGGLLENVCHICGIKFTTRSNLLYHIKRHEGIRNYACTMCPKKFFASHSLKVHIRSHTKECPYTCEKCGMSFVSASKLNQHVKRHSNQKDFACNYCPKAFYTAFERDRHVRRHLNIRDKACPICGKTFVAGSSYYAHMMLHNDTKRFKCDKCDMKFAQYAGLYKHKKRHHTGIEGE